MNFEISAPGKWILSGEHSVLRGVPALVFPLSAKRLCLSYAPAGGERVCSVSGSYSDEIKIMFWGVLERACQIAGTGIKNLEGHYKLHGDLPLGSGLGASASLCVALGRLLAARGYVQEQDLYKFCCELENLFHGESSGVDIAVALGARGLRFVRGGSETRTITPLWQPHCYLTYSGRRGVTSECVAQVKQFLVSWPQQGQALDQKMREASQLCEQGLMTDPVSGGYQLLRDGMALAAECFYGWGLVDPMCLAQIERLKAAGAEVVKPTGSGGGGYLLSLWPEAPAHSKELELTPAFELPS